MSRYLRAMTLALVCNLAMGTPGAAKTSPSEREPASTQQPRIDPAGAIPFEAPARSDDSNSDDDLTVQPPDPDVPDARVVDPASLPPVHYGADELPKPVARLRSQILKAAESGEIDNLLPVLQSNETMPILSLDTIGDPIAFLKESSGDGEGRELLALLSEIMESGWVHVGMGTPQEMYVWPYFTAYPIDTLSSPQKVELYRILTASDVEEMQNYGGYVFYRVGIGPDGTWHYFVAGE